MRRIKINRNIHTRRGVRQYLKTLFFRLLFPGMSLFVVGLGGYYIYRSFAPSCVVVTYNKIFSDFVKDDIDDFSQKYLNSIDLCAFNPKDFSENLKQQFNVVKNVSWRWNSFDRAEICVEGVTPSICVNDEFVFGDKKGLFPQSLFQTVTLDDLHSLRVNPLLVDNSYANTFMGGDTFVEGGAFIISDSFAPGVDIFSDKLPSRVYTFLKNLPDTYLQSYTVTYSDQNCVFLKKKEFLKDYGLQFVVSDKMLDGRGIDDGASSSHGRLHLKKLGEDATDFSSIEVAGLLHDDFVKRKKLGEKKGYRFRSRKRRVESVAYDLRFKGRICAKIVRDRVKRKHG